MMDYEEFRKQYEIQHPASVPRFEEAMGIYPDWLEKVVGAMFFCASLLSGVHTVPAVRGGMTNEFWPQPIVDTVSMLSFVAIELVFFVAAYALMRKRQWHVIITLISAFIVAMVANLQQNILAYQAGDPGTIIVAVTLGIGAPLIAFMAGKMFVDIYRARRTVNIEARKNFETACKAWDDEIMDAFKAAERAEKRASKRLSRVSNGQQGRGTEQASRRSDASQIVRDHFAENPGDLNLSPRQLAQLLDVGKSTVHNVQRELRSNGNGQH